MFRDINKCNLKKQSLPKGISQFCVEIIHFLLEEIDDLTLLINSINSKKY